MFGSPTRFVWFLFSMLCPITANSSREKPDLLTQDGHFGLIGMQERATLLGGTFQMRAAPGQGTRVVARLPALPASE